LVLKAALLPRQSCFVRKLMLSSQRGFPN